MNIHSYLSPKCIVKTDGSIHRNGVFAKELIKKGELIAAWGGYVMTSEQVRGLPKEILDFDYPVQIAPGLYLGPKHTKDLDDSEMFNHSCQANAGVKGQNLLVARRSIRPNEEICFDYETTDTSDMEFECRCGSLKCRKHIDGSAWKGEDFQKANRGYLSWYIEELIRSAKK